jgi:Pectate lyase superfamily protein
MADTKLSLLPLGTGPGFYYGLDQAGSSKRFTSAGVFNVKDFGAIGNNIADDTSAIQAAINAAAVAGNGAGRAGRVVFPPGHYKTTAALVNNVASGYVSLVGSGWFGTELIGLVAGYIVDQNSANAGDIIEISGLSIRNTHTAPDTGALRMCGITNSIIMQCRLQGVVGANCFENLFETAFYNCAFTGPFGAGSVEAAATIGIAITQGGIYQCDFTSWGDACRASNVGVTIKGCRFENNIRAIAVGIDDQGNTDGCSGWLIEANSFERNNRAIHLITGSAGAVIGNYMSGTTDVLGTGEATEHFKMDTCNGVLVAGNTASGQLSVAAYNLTDIGGGSNVFIGNIAGNALSPFTLWTVGKPTNAYFLGCEGLTPVTTLTGTAHVLTEAHHRIIDFTNGSAVAFTIPQDVNFGGHEPPLYVPYKLTQAGAGTVTVSAGVSCTLNFLAGRNVLGGQYDVRYIERTAASTWRLW